MQRLLFVLLFLVASAPSIAQDTVIQQRLITGLDVFDINGLSLANAWAGGMNAPQFSRVDIDRDGKEDLISFDREDNRFQVFINENTAGNTSYRYAPEYLDNLADCNCNSWALFRDYNGDGLKDLFCGTPDAYVLVYDQRLYSGDSVGFVNTYVNLLSDKIIKGTNRSFYLFVSKVDLPGLVDVDGDGDLDVLTFGIVSNYVEWHRNFAVEEYGRIDTLLLERETACWGHFVENNFTNDVELHDTNVWTCPLGNFDPVANGCETPGNRPAPPSNGNNQRHAGSTVTPLDLNGDNIYDLLIGDVSYPNMYGLFNCGTAQYAYMDSAQTNFPETDVPIDVDVFPAAYWIDVDDDGARDLIVAPNTRTTFENANGVTLYKNYGLDLQGDYRFEKKGFLQGEMIDVGSDADPVFVHLNSDTLLDLLVANSFSYIPVQDTGYEYGGIYAYLNTGSAAVPAFTLVDNDFLGISANSLTDSVYRRLRQLSPAAADLDNDGDEDLLIGNGFGELAYFRQDGQSGGLPTFTFVTDALTDAGGTRIKVGNNASPEFYDFDGDGDLDLFIGEEHGKVHYYQNTGNPSSPAFTEVTDKFGKIKLSNGFGSPFAGGTHPAIVDYDHDGEDELVLGSELGWLLGYKGLSSGLSDSLVVSDTLARFNFGRYSAPEGAVIDSTGFTKWLVGNRRGGLNLLETYETVEDTTSVSNAPEIPVLPVRIYPNPARELVQIEPGAAVDGPISLRLFNTVGQVVRTQPAQAGKQTLRVSGLAPGLYFLELSDGKQRSIHKLLVETP